MIRVLLVALAFCIIIPSLNIGAEIEIEGTDSIWKSDLAESDDLSKISQPLTPNVLAIYADSCLEKELQKPYGIENISKTTSPKIVVEDAGSSFEQDIQKPSNIESIAKPKTATIIIENADSSFSFGLSHPLASSQTNLTKGDVNEDGVIRSNDAILALRISAGFLTPTENQRWSADMNGDGQIRSNDAILILRKAAGLEAPVKDALARVARKITIALNDIRGVSGESIDVPVKVDNFDGLAGGDISIVYDNSVLKAVDVSSDSDIDFISNIDKSGNIRIAFAGYDGLKSKELFNIKFNVIADRISPLTLQNVELYRDDATPIDSTIVNGNFRSWAIAPAKSALLQNFPNPFNPETWIPYQLKEASDVKIFIYSASGQLVRKLDLEYKSAGVYSSQDRSAYWDGRNDSGEKVSNGVYFYRIQANGFSDVKKMTILK